MQMLPDEEVLIGRDNIWFIGLLLTTHRVRCENKAFGNITLTSIMLEQITSIRTVRKSYPWLFLIAGLILLIGLVSQRVEWAFYSFLVGSIIVIIYFATLRTFLEIASGGAKINHNIRGLSLERVKEFIDTLEEAKNQRYLNK